MTKHMNPVVIATALAISLCLAFSAKADIAFDNYAPDWDAYPGSGRWVSAASDPWGEWQQAYNFTAQASGYVTDMWACVTHTDFTLFESLCSCEMNLTKDSNGLPGATLETFQFVDEIPYVHSGVEAIHKTGTATTYLEAGQTYWLVLSTEHEFIDEMTSDVLWGDAVDDTGTSARFDVGNSVWDHIEYNTKRGAFRIDVTPEPTTLLMLLGATPLLLKRRRNQRA